jgi:tRNA(Ile)-lysidine synthase
VIEPPASTLPLLPDPLEGPGNHRFLIAFSGGADSTALAHRMAVANAGRALLCIHIDHQLDKESGRRAARAHDIARRIGLDCVIERVEVLPSASPEAAARKARYQALARYVTTGDTLLMAHHADDQVETVILRLLRGAGPTGLAGIPAVRRFAAGWLMRPLLERTRAEIQDYCRAHGLDWIEDPTNRSLSADRNFLRLQILPRLRSRWPGLAHGVRRSARLSAEAGLFVEEKARALMSDARQDDRILRAGALLNCSTHLKAEVLRLWCQATVGTTPPGKPLDAFLQQVDGCPPDRVPELRWGSAALRFWSGRFWLDEDRVRHPYEIHWTAARALQLPGGLGELELCGAERNDVWSFRVCSGRPGERIRPACSQHHRRVSELMRLEGVPPWERDGWPRLYIGQDLVAVGARWIERDFSQHLSSRGLNLVWRGLESSGHPPNPQRLCP